MLFNLKYSTEGFVAQQKILAKYKMNSPVVVASHLIPWFSGYSPIAVRQEKIFF